MPAAKYAGLGIDPQPGIVPRTYHQVHSGLHWAFGKASTYPCVSCKTSARSWAYQYSAGNEELIDERGRVYSEDFSHYAPMCDSCHAKFDWAHDPKVNARAALSVGRARANELTRSDPARQLDLRIAGVKGRASFLNRLAVDDALREQYVFYGNKLAALNVLLLQTESGRERFRASGLAAMRIRRRCGECGLESTPPGIGRHQKFSGHAGYEDL